MTQVELRFSEGSILTTLNPKHIRIQKSTCGDLPKNVKSTLHGPLLDGEGEESRESIKNKQGKKVGRERKD